MKRTVLTIVLFVILTPAIAGDHPVCRSLAFDYNGLTPVEMRHIAATCYSDKMATLLYNRAYHANLLSEYERLSRLTIRDRTGSAAHIESYRIHMALLESFAAKLAPDDPFAIDLLNAQYELRREAIELRLKGYNWLVIRTPTPERIR